MGVKRRAMPITWTNGWVYHRVQLLYSLHRGKALTDQAENLTQLLRRLSSGDEEAAARVAAAAYGELRKLAARFLRRERSGHTLQPTALVHEAFLKLLANTRAEWRDRAQFYAVAAANAANSGRLRA